MQPPPTPPTPPRQKNHWPWRVKVTTSTLGKWRVTFFTNDGRLTSRVIRVISVLPVSYRLSCNLPLTPCDVPSQWGLQLSIQSNNNLVHNLLNLSFATNCGSFCKRYWPHKDVKNKGHRIENRDFHWPFEVPKELILSSSYTHTSWNVHGQPATWGFVFKTKTSLRKNWYLTFCLVVNMHSCQF